MSPSLPSCPITLMALARAAAETQGPWTCRPRRRGSQSRVQGGAGGKRPRRSQLAPLGHWRNLEQLPLTLRPALRALRPRDGATTLDRTPESSTSPQDASGTARSDTAAAAEPMLGVDSWKRSRFLAFSLIRFIRSTAAAQNDFLDVGKDAPCLAAALMAQRPPCNALRKRNAKMRCSRPSGCTIKILEKEIVLEPPKALI